MTAIAAVQAIARTRRADQRLRRLRISLLYWWRHGRWPDLDRPRAFTEWVQWRKLDGDDRLDPLTDKLRSKHYVAERCGAELSVPTIWSGEDLPEVPPGPFPLIVKANHSCGQTRVVRCQSDWVRARRAARRWVRGTYGRWLDERPYRAASRLVLVEPLLGDGRRLPEDFKVYVFGGRAAIVQHHVDRGTRRHRWTQFDRGWTRVGGSASDVLCPPCLPAMLAAAETIAASVDFLRVDFYAVSGRIWFGEFALFPGSGLDPFYPGTLDRDLGDLWTAARAS